MRIPLRGLTLAVVFSCMASAQGVPTPVGPAVLTVPVAVNSTVTSCATPVVIPNVSANTQLALFVNIKASPTGTTPTLTYTISEVDPGDGTTVFTGAQTSSTLAINAIGDAAPITLSTTHSTAIKVSCVITGASASFTQVYVTLTAFGGALNTIQGCGTAGAPSCGVVTVQPPSSGSPSMPVTAPGGFNAADQNAATTSLSTACSLTTACLNTASIQWPMNGASSSEVTITASSSPLGFTSQVVDASYDATGTTYTNAKCVMVRSDATSTGTVKIALANADLTSTPSSWEIMCPGAPSFVRFRVAGTPTSGSFNVAGHAVFAPGQARTQGAAIANGAPLNAAGSNIGQAMMAVSSTTATTGVMVRADATGVLTSTQGPAANGATQTGNPLQESGVARATGAAPTQVTAGQVSALTTDLEHRLWVAAEHPNGSSCIVDAASASTQCVGLSGASLSYYIKSVSFSASAAITFKVNSSTTAGNACATAPALVIPTSYMGANTGGTFTFPQPIKVTANSALCCLPSGASGSCIIAGYIAP